MSYDESIGELFVLGFRGTSVPPWLRAFAHRHGLGGVLLFDYDVQTARAERNVESPAQLRALCAEVAALPGAPLVFVDQEGGRVRRLKEARGFAPLPSAEDFAALPPDEQSRIARRAYAELRELGIGYNLAPVVDLALRPDSPDICALQRSYGPHPGAVEAIAMRLDTVAREVGLGLCLKHYPGLGGATADSHKALTDLGPSLTETQLALFHALAPRIHGEAVLVSHGVVPQWEPDCPASVSPVALRRLRAAAPEALLLSDDLQMAGLQQRYGSAEACRRGLAAGLDLLVLGNNLRDESDACSAFAAALASVVGESTALAASAGGALARVRDRKRRFGRRR